MKMNNETVENTEKYVSDEFIAGILRDIEKYASDHDELIEAPEKPNIDESLSISENESVSEIKTPFVERIFYDLYFKYTDIIFKYDCLDYEDKMKLWIGIILIIICISSFIIYYYIPV